MALDPTAALVILVVSAFAPPLLFLGLVRRTERYGREPLGRVLRTFLWGAIFAVILAFLLSFVVYSLYQEVDRVYVFSGRLPNLETVVLALLIAPFTEELAKGVGVYLARPIIDEPEDGIVYGAASGFGFAASENLLYGMAAFVAPGGTLELSLLVIGVRSVSSALLHASATAAFGYGIAAQRVWPDRFRAFPYYLLAVAMHSTYNLLASLGEFERPLIGENAALIGLVGAIALAFVAFAAIRAKLRRTDAKRVTW